MVRHAAGTGLVAALSAAIGLGFKQARGPLARADQAWQSVSQRRWGVRKRPPVPHPPLLVVVARQLTSRQLQALAWLERAGTRVVGFVEIAAPVPFTLLRCSALPSDDAAAAVAVTLLAGAGDRRVPIWRPDQGGVALTWVRATPEPAVELASLRAASEPAAPGRWSLEVDAVAATAGALHLVAPSSPLIAQTVSVIMTAYNDGPFIAQALACLRAQTHADLEIVVVDDASTDDTRARVEAIAAGDPRVRLIALPHNVGLFAARNVGLAAATGTYVTFHDPDDLSRVDRIARCVAAVADVDYVYGQFVRTLPNGAVTRLGTTPIYQEGIITLLFRRALLERVGYFDPLRVAADSEFIERLRALRLRARSLPDVLYFARLRQHSLTTALGPHAIYTVDGALTKNPVLTAYVKTYRAAHRRRGDLRIAAAPIDRPFAAAPSCLGGDQQRWFEHHFGPIGRGRHPLIASHAAATLVRVDALGGRSLRALLAEPRAVRAGIVVVSHRATWIEATAANLRRQVPAPTRVVVVDNSPEGHVAAWTAALAGLAGVEIVRAAPPVALGACLNLGIKALATDVDVVLKFDDDDHYGARYLAEQVAVHAAAGGVVGKFPLAFYTDAEMTLYLRPAARASLAASPHVAGSTLTFAVSLWRALGFAADLTLGEDRDFITRAKAAGQPVTSSSIFNHCARRHRDQAHTWQVPASTLFAPDMATAVFAGPWAEVPALLDMRAQDPEPR